MKNFMFTSTSDEGLWDWTVFQSTNIKQYIIDQAKKDEESFGWVFEDYTESSKNATYEDFAKDIINQIDKSFVDGDSMPAMTIIFIDGANSNVLVPGRQSTLDPKIRKKLIGI